MNLEPALDELSELGKKSTYDSAYNPGRLLALERAPKRLALGIDPMHLPFFGYDFWNHYEVSWLNLKGKPMVALAEIYYDCRTTHIIESKSLKLYFNSLNQAKFGSLEELASCIRQDLETCLHAKVELRLKRLNDPSFNQNALEFVAENIDDLDVTCSDYQVNPSFLKVSHEDVEECLSSDLLKSNCLVTNQPDWGSVFIAYRGPKIDRLGLLKYLVSFRNHNEFHEQCIERIFVDIQTHCKPQELTVYGCYTRRGGLDINPYRSTLKPNNVNPHQRLIRQ